MFLLFSLGRGDWSGCWKHRVLPWRSGQYQYHQHQWHWWPQQPAEYWEWRVTPVPVSNCSLPRTQHDMTVQGKIFTGPIQSKQSLKLGSWCSLLFKAKQTILEQRVERPLFKQILSKSKQSLPCRTNIHNIHIWKSQFLMAAENVCEIFNLI